jgi:hypothetical protein
MAALCESRQTIDDGARGEADGRQSTRNILHVSVLNIGLSLERARHLNSAMPVRLQRSQLGW